MFFNRKKGEDNLIQLSFEQIDKIPYTPNNKQVSRNINIDLNSSKPNKSDIIKQRNQSNI